MIIVEARATRRARRAGRALVPALIHVAFFDYSRDMRMLEVIVQVIDIFLNPISISPSSYLSAYIYTNYEKQGDEKVVSLTARCARGRATPAPAPRSGRLLIHSLA